MNVMSWIRRSTVGVAIATAAVYPHAQQRPSQPEPPSGWNAKTLATAKRQMVAAAHPLAVEAGLEMLDRGGNAIDATIATQLVLGLVEPQASGIGGGAFLLHHDARKEETVAYDGRETAPAAAHEGMFLTPEGKPMAFGDAVVGGRSVGVPGVPRLLEVAHARHGKLAWGRLFEPAIRIAAQGFPVSRRMHKLLSEDQALPQQAAARAIFYASDGTAKAAGEVIRNPEYAQTLRLIAAKGADAFYRGELGKDIVAAVRGHAGNPGLMMTAADLADYRVRTVQPLCGRYRSWTVCGMPPSSSGGVAVLQILGVLSHFDMASVRPNSTEAVHLIVEAERLAFADRARWVADDRFAEVPVVGLIDHNYLAERARLVQRQQTMGRAEAGTPAGAKVAWADDALDEVAGTSHISIVDREGNAVSMTTTIEGFFGSKLMVRGFLLNNQLTDFNFLPVEAGRPVANRVAPGKRPRSSMAPTLVFDRNGRLEMTLGSPGGSLIIGYVAKTLIGTLDWKLDMQSAIDLPNMGSRNGPTELEKGSVVERLDASLQALGHEVRVMDMTSGLHGIRRSSSGWEGGADSRREGVAKGR